MSVPISQMLTVASYVLGQKLRRKKRYPLVLMLEPLYRCNLACSGCGKIQYPSQILKSQITLEQVLKAVDECPAPMVSIPGGEPLMHPEIDKIVGALVERKKYVYLCSNAILLEEKLHLFKPSKYLTFSIHMDGLKEEHDFAVCRDGVYDKALHAIRIAVQAGFRVTTNTTLFNNSEPSRVREFFDAMTDAGVEGMMLSPGYSYQKAPDQKSFLERQKTQELFREIFDKPKKRWKFNLSPLFMEYLMGARHLECTPWGNPSFSVFGWQKPCYLLQDGYEATFDDLISKTNWNQYGRESGNPACQNCMVHCGHEPTAVDITFGTWSGFLATVRATLKSPRVPSLEELKNFVLPPTRKFVAPPVPEAKQGERIAVKSVADLKSALDYRGNVTLHLQTGLTVDGYVSNLSDAHLTLVLETGLEKELPVSSVREVHYSGRDTAEGKSWELWVKKYQEEKGSPSFPDPSLSSSLH